MGIYGARDQWYVQLRWRGRTIQRAVHGTREDAEAFERELAATRDRGEPPPDGRRRALRPYSFADLEHAARAPDLSALARWLEVHRRQVERWRCSGLTEEQADTLACRLGLHPALIWPEWFDNIEEAA